jgi:integrase
MLMWAEQEGFCRNPIRKWPEVPSVPPPTRYFDKDDLGKLLKAVPPDLADMLVFGTLTGLRPQELRSLQRSNIVTNESGRLFVRIEHHKTSASSKVPIPRTVPLSPEAAAIVQRQMEAHPKSDTVFLNDDGNPYTAVGFRQRLQRWCKRAKVPTMPPYALRHVFGTRQASNGTNQAILAQLMGHSNLQTTARYVVNCDEAHLKAVDDMAKQIIPVTQNANHDLGKAS